jgi:type I restriction enzyme S subunit
MEFLEEMEYVEDIPEGWKWVKLGEIINQGLCELLDKHRIPLSDKQRNKMKNGILYPYYGANGIIDYVNNYIFDGEFILVAEDGTVSTDKGKPVVQYVNGKFWVSNHAHVIRCKNSTTLKFLYYALKNVDIIPYITGAVQPKLNQRNILDIEILYALNVSEQKAIADVLSSIDDKIELLHRQNKTLEEMAMTLFRQWFIEPTKDGLPDGWEEVSLGELIEISSGKSIEKAKLKEKGLYPVLGANGEIGRTDNWLYEGELIYTGRVGTLGNVFMVFKNEKVWLTDNTLVIKPKKNEYFYFVYFTLKNAKLDEYNSGSTQPLIRQSDIKKIEIFLPKINSLRDFEIISRNIFTKIQFNKLQIQTLEKLRDTLLPKLMSGEIRVKI